jgi:8-oxo-dGTP pyrophosphatase MutT (NUDIX family)
MSTPEFIRRLRRHIGHEPLWLAGATAVIRDRSAGAVLLVRRADSGAWTPVTGIIDPGEKPAAAAAREAEEEAGVRIEVRRLAQVGVTELITYGNGDQAQYIDHTFECEWISGEAHPADGENTEVRWVPEAELSTFDGIPPHMQGRMRAALSGEERARF